jgi:hypothetical protein
MKIESNKRSGVLYSCHKLQGIGLYKRGRRLQPSKEIMVVGGIAGLVSSTKFSLATLNKKW